jgi:WD40 repeat protein
MNSFKDALKSSFVQFTVVMNQPTNENTTIAWKARQSRRLLRTMRRAALAMLSLCMLSFGAWRRGRGAEPLKCLLIAAAVMVLAWLSLLSPRLATAQGRPDIEWMAGGHADYVNSVAFSPDGTLLASGSDDKTIKLWRVSDGSLVRTLTGHTYWVNSVAFSPDGTLLASGSSD